MNRYYFDKDTVGIARKWVDWLGHGAVLATRGSLGLEVNGVQLKADESFVIFYHMSYATAENIGVYANQYRNAVHVGVSGNGNSVMSKEFNAYLVKSSVGKPDDPSFAARVCRFLNRLEQSAKPNFVGLEPGGDEALALRLLCEAYAMPTDEKGGRSYEPIEQGGQPIPVYCPDPKTWFDLLGASIPADEKDEAAIAAFGGLMGDAERDAKTLARAIVRGDSDISGAAGKFVEKVLEITDVQAGGAE